MENTATGTNFNPLSKFFRQPSVYVKLPSNGEFWYENSLDLPVNGEIPIYPMTARDEITLRTPDALMNGSGVVDVIQSCCPNIRNAWNMPSIDVDTVLIAIRVASYGTNMDVTTKCPFCSAENTHGIDLQHALAGITCPDYSKKLDIDNLKIKLIPQPYFAANRQNSINFEEQRMMTALEKADSAERTREISDSMSRLIQIGIDTVTASTEYIELDNGVKVTEKDFIKEFYENANGKIVKSVQTHLGKLNNDGSIKPQTAACAECTKEYQIPLVFDYASFFDQGS
jgi:T4 bacteriophage base plate protein